MPLGINACLSHIEPTPPKAAKRPRLAIIAANDVRAFPAPGPIALDPRMVSALEMLARLLAPFVAAALGQAKVANDDEGWFDQTSSPLGPRSHCALARRGTLPARKVGRRWLVRRADLEAFIAEHGHAPDMPPDPAEEAQDLEARVRAVASEVGMVLAAPTRATEAKKTHR